jgi:hypothetical protein
MKNNLHPSREAALLAIDTMTENVNQSGRRSYFEGEFESGSVGVIIIRVTGKKLDYRTFLYRMKVAK